MEAVRVWPTIDQDVIHECTQRKEREWWEGNKHIAVMVMFVCVCACVCACVCVCMFNVHMC